MREMPSLPAPTQPRMAGEDRRRQLIEVAIDLFSRKGFAGTTTKEIAAAAGITEAMIFRHFATKQELYKAILDYKCGGENIPDWLAQAQSFMENSDDEGLFRFLLSSIIRMHREHPEFERLLIHAALEGHELAIMHNDQMATSVGAQFNDYIARRQREGAIRECDPSIVLFSVVGLPRFYALKKYIHHRGLPFEDEQVVETMLSILMNGLRTREHEGKSS
jgi:TetR/AcrR family transcriptional regulator